MRRALFYAVILVFLSACGEDASAPAGGSARDMVNDYLLDAPTTPSGLGISAVLKLKSGASFYNTTVWWNPSEGRDPYGPAGYKVYSNGSLIGSVISNSAFYTDMFPGKYCYRVSAFNSAGGESILSDEECITLGR